MTGMIATMTVRTDRLAAAAPTGFALATDVAEWLVRQGVPFRDAHEIVGRLVVLCLARDCELEDLAAEDLADVSPHLTPEVRDVLTVTGALASRSARGGTAPARVTEQLAELREQLVAQRAWASSGA
jgi:argininosuccinate lyase